jgi:hypothetical protein
MLLAAALPDLFEEPGAVSLPYSVQYGVGCREELADFSPGVAEPVSAGTGARVVPTTARTKQSIGQITMQALFIHG